MLRRVASEAARQGGACPSWLGHAETGRSTEVLGAFMLSGPVLSLVERVEVVEGYGLSTVQISTICAGTYRLKSKISKFFLFVSE